MFCENLIVIRRLGLLDWENLLIILIGISLDEYCKTIIFLGKEMIDLENYRIWQNLTHLKIKRFHLIDGGEDKQVLF
jgi:hypothetical protein